MAQNILTPFEVSSLPLEAIPFDKIKTDMFLPALQESLKQAKARLEALRSSQEPPTFMNTCVELEKLNETTEMISNVFYNQLSSNTSDELQKLADQFGPLLSDFSNDIILDEKLFARIRTVFDNTHRNDVTVEEYELLDSQFKDFVRNGAMLDNEKKAVLREIDAEMAKLSPQFADNILKATNAFTLHIEDKSQLSGLPESSLAAAAEEAKNRKLNGWVFTLHAPSYIPFVTYADNRELREKMYRAYLSRCFNDKFDNQKLLLRILELREKRAKLLGYETHAHFTLERRMAETPEKVFQFLERLEKASFQAAKKDISKVTELAASMGGPKELAPWDFAYYSEKLKEKLFQYSGEELRPYFPLEHVIEGVFAHANKLYSLNFTERKDIPLYHPDVRTYEVTDDNTGKYIGLFYVDLFPRESKKGGAWMTNYRGQGMFHGKVRRPHVAIVCNFTKPTADAPSLLTFDEVNTLFHEFGHALHGLLSQCRFRSLSGTNVRWDFVELPSQIMENWILERESLDLVSKHYKTGEKLPDSYAQKIKDSSRFLAGYMSLRQVTFATLDMMWHTTPFHSITDVDEFEKKAIARMQVIPPVKGTNVSVGFAHIFSGGYSAGYYSYKWAEVLDADAFEYFKENGIFSRKVADKFRHNILERGGTENPMELYKAFRGREPDPDALLRRDQLI